MRTFMKGACAGLLIVAGAAALGVPAAEGDGPQAGASHPVAIAGSGRPQQAGAGNVVAVLAQSSPLQGAPGERQAPAGGTRSAAVWPFHPQRDTFRPDALLDLRALNEPIAGQSGFIRLSADKNDFVRGDGVPLRFWAVNFDFSRNPNLESLGHTARFLAKRGVNLVRLNGFLESHAKNSRVTDADPKVIDQAWRLVAAMKKEGIYTVISPYWAAEVKHVPASWDLGDWPENVSPQGLLFFNPKLQKGYKTWLKDLLTRRNPYTGIPIARDPAVALIQIQNEDSLLFWTEQGIKGQQLTLLGQQFGDWARRKYGSLEACAARLERSVDARGRSGSGRPGCPPDLAVHQAADRGPQEAA